MLKALRSTIFLVDPPKSTIVTLEEAKNYLKVDHDDDNKLIETMIKACEQEVESLIRKDLLPKLWRYMVDFPVNREERSINLVGISFPHSSIKFPLPHSPVISIEAVSCGTSIFDRGDYSAILNARDSIIRIKSKCFLGHVNNGEVSVNVVFKSGMYETAVDVPETVKVSLLMLLADKYQRRNIESFYCKKRPISRGVLSLLLPLMEYRFV